MSDGPRSRVDGLVGIGPDELAKLGGEQALDEAFGILADRYCRYALTCLSDRSSATLEEVADVVTGLDATATNDVATPARRDLIRRRLHHVVLPELDAAGYVEFDADAARVTEIRVPEFVDRLLAIGT